MTWRGLKGYVTNLTDMPPAELIDRYHQLFEVEKSSRMSTSDLKALPIFHHKRESIDAHLTIVFTALAVSRWIEQRSGWSIKKLVKNLRRYKTITLNIDGLTATASEPLTPEHQAIYDRISQQPSVH